MTEFVEIRKSEYLARGTIFVFLGITIQSLIIFPSVWASLQGTVVKFFSIDFVIVYLTISFAYSLVTSLYLNPKMVISPYYTQIGTAALIGLVIIIHLTAYKTDASNIVGFSIVFPLEFIIFTIFGFFESKFLRKVIGVYGNENDIYNETYRIDADYNFVRRLFDADFFASYDINESEDHKQIIAKRKNSSDIQVLILLESDPKSPLESIISISTCEIKFESIWKTKKALNALNVVSRFIDGELYENNLVRMVLDTEEEIMTNKCQMKLLESLESALSVLSKMPSKILLAIGGLLAVGVTVTVLRFMPVPTEFAQIDTNTLVGTWVAVVTTILYLTGSELKLKILKKQS